MDWIIDLLPMQQFCTIMFIRILWGSFLAGERMSEKPTMTLDEIILVEMQHKLILLPLMSYTRRYRYRCLPIICPMTRKVRQLSAQKRSYH